MNLWFSQDGNNLVVGVIGSNDSVVLNDCYVGSSSQVDDITAGGVNLDSFLVDQ
jgi:hypothetical protein